MPQVFCPVCWGFVPLVSQNVGKALGGTAAAIFGIGARTAYGKFLGALASSLVGYPVEEAAGPVCGRCGSPPRSVM